MKSKVKVGLIGSQFITAIHAEALKACQLAEIVAVASPTPGNAARFAKAQEIPHAFEDYRKMLEMPEIDMVVIGKIGRAHV